MQTLATEYDAKETDKSSFSEASNTFQKSWHAPAPVLQGTLSTPGSRVAPCCWITNEEQEELHPASGVFSNQHRCLNALGGQKCEIQEQRHDRQCMIDWCDEQRGKEQHQHHRSNSTSWTEHSSQQQQQSELQRSLCLQSTKHPIEVAPNAHEPHGLNLPQHDKQNQQQQDLQQRRQLLACSGDGKQQQKKIADVVWQGGDEQQYQCSVQETPWRGQIRGKGRPDKLQGPSESQQYEVGSSHLFQNDEENRICDQAPNCQRQEHPQQQQKEPGLAEGGAEQQGVIQVRMSVLQAARLAFMQEQQQVAKVREHFRCFKAVL